MSKRYFVNNLKIFAKGAMVGAIVGTIVLASASHFIGQIIKRKDEALKKQFSLPKFEASFSPIKEGEQFTFDYYGNEISIQGDSVKIYTFDENGNMTVKEGEKAQIPVQDNAYLLDEYISEREATVYRVLKNSDNIKDQYNIFILFNLMEQLYEEYLHREPFNTLEQRKEAIYKVCYDYIVSNTGYRMGGYKYSELPKTIQRDILEIYKSIDYMRKNGNVKEESTFDRIIEGTGYVLKYELFKIGRK